MRKHESHSHEMDLSRDYLQELGYEPRDVSLPVLLRWLVILFVFFGLTALGTWGMYYIFVAEEPNQNARSLDVNMRKIPGAPNPLLQGYPLDDIQKFRDKEAQHLDNYHWQDRAKGIATMPVDKALDIVAEKGLPSKGQVTPTKIDSDAPTFDATRPPSGMIETTEPFHPQPPSGEGAGAPSAGGTATPPTAQHDRSP